MVEAWCMERIEEDKIDQWWFEMDAPLPGEAKKEPTRKDWEDDGDSFMAAMGSLMGKG